MKPAIRVEDLSKQYRIGTATRQATRNLTESIVHTAGDVWRTLTGRAHGTDGSNHFWALKDVSFEVQSGEVVGIIGRNGAGKSTLLKILSRIVEPTSGRAIVRGRLGSLLEVGTGFHPELTGRENVYLNGSILGMSRHEIDRKFDDIVSFAEVDRFLETPVKRYSSGMYVRLAFAVAAHLQPEILIVDEVLAVGDAAFQSKCLGKMREVGRSGHTVLFVTHNMAAVRALCQRCLFVDRGSIVADSAPEAGVDAYLASVGHDVHAQYDLRGVRRAAGHVPVMETIRIKDSAGELCGRIPCGEEVVLEFDLTFPYSFQEPQIGIGFDDALGQRVCSVATYLSKSVLPPIAGRATIECAIRDLPLAPGHYTLSLSVGSLQNPLMDQIEHVVGLDVTPDDFYSNGRVPAKNHGLVLLRSTWGVLGPAQAKDQASRRPRVRSETEVR